MQSILIVGASVRAAAQSAIAAGLRPACIDLFADADLCRLCPARTIAAGDYPRGFIEAARDMPAGPWLYTGALENHPRVIDAMTRERPLWGNDGRTVARVRIPELVALVLKEAGLPCPAVGDPTHADPDEDWLLKPRRGAAGSGVRRWRGERVGRSRYLQKWVEGDACSALYVGHAGKAELLGATRQLVGVPWLHADGFRYCGNVGPLALPASLEHNLRELGQVLVRVFSLRGLIGVDFILKDEVPWPIEINPRYTASVEVLERATGETFLIRHRQAFDTSTSPPSRGMSVPAASAANPAGPPRVHAKAILFAKVPLSFPTDIALDNCADIPHPGTAIAKGQPILTLFAAAGDAATCLEILREKAQALDRRLFGC